MVLKWPVRWSQNVVGLRGSFLEQGGLKETQGQVTDSYMENTAYETDLGKKDKKYSVHIQYRETLFPM